MQQCLVIGDPIAQSLSPLLHNKAYELLGLQDQFSFTAEQVTKEQLPSFMQKIRNTNVRGLSCTVPHKEAVIPLLDELDETAKVIGAVNTIVQENGKLKGYNTDWQGIVEPLKKVIDLKGKRVVVVGAGGGARGAVYGLLREGAIVTIVNRTKEKAQILAGDFSVVVSEWPKIVPEIMDIIINATSVGMDPNRDESAVPSEFILPRHIAFDIVYNPLETRFLQDAKKKSATIIHGTEMLLIQAAEQFRLYTGREMPVEEIRPMLISRLLSSK